MTDPNLSLGGNSHPIKIIPEAKTIRFLRDLITKFALASILGVYTLLLYLPQYSTDYSP